MSEPLSDHERETTLHVARAMYPHDALPDEAYREVVRAVEAEAAGSEEVRTAIEQGVAALDDPTPFGELTADARLQALRAAEGSAYFDLVRATAVVALYDNPLVWQAFGYEGASVHLGGYVDRGFDDLDWLPDPPIELDPAAGSHHAATDAR
ncbi:MAG: hypothetical protein QOI64_2041 [Solirubrobacteraceae bacterium]|nr:hypothetical protein [Solirubrobacteraceae bacterium]